MMIRELLTIELTAPMVAALISLIVKSNAFLGIISVISVCISLSVSLVLLFNVINGTVINVELFNGWLNLPGIKPIGMSFTLDFLSIILNILVCGLSILILTYSISYMGKDENYSDTRRFWFLMLIFVSSMLVVINSNNFILMFIGWEGMSLSSYLLIGYYYGDEKEHWIGGPPSKTPMYKPSYCSYITFLIVGSADTLMLLGILLLMSITGSPYYEDLHVIRELIYGGTPSWIVVLSLILFIVGPIAKSAQFPLHVWLPYAMAGPTPVSALLHSATMVKGGVYIILRLLPYFVEIANAIDTASLLFYILIASGIGSMIIGAIYAGRTVELKRVLAYSTISQIGYMFILLGLSRFLEIPLLAGAATLYHLINHALFKSALFLIAGILIHVTSTIYLDEMKLHIKGFKSLFMITLISSLSLIGVPPLMGFWSKEFIIETIVGGGHNALFLITVLGTFLTAFYATRMIVIIFSGSDKAIHTYHEINELMYYPPLILAFATFLAGILGLDIKGNILKMVTLIEEIEHVHLDLSFMVISLSAIFLGVLLAIYVNQPYLSRPLTYYGFLVKLKMIYRLRAFLSSIKGIPRHYKTLKYIHTFKNRVKSLICYESFCPNTRLVTIVAKDLFNALNNFLNLVVTYVGIYSYKGLRKLFDALSYADIDTFLTTYMIALSIFLTGVLLLIR
ncbi:MAG: NADH-quinone oxidoreductase subunit L [Sulfolobales archaeon]